MTEYERWDDLEAEIRATTGVKERVSVLVKGILKRFEEADIDQIKLRLLKDQLGLATEALVAAVTAEEA